MDLKLNFTPPIPQPGCGYKVTLRKQGNPTYTTSSYASAIPRPYTLTGLPDGNYEGTIACDCCESNTSTTIPWGANCWNPVSIAPTWLSSFGLIQPNGSEIPEPRVCVIWMYMKYNLAYPLRIHGSFDLWCGGVYNKTVPFDITIPVTGAPTVLYIKDTAGYYQTWPCSTGWAVTNVIAAIDTIYLAGSPLPHCKPYLHEALALPTGSGFATPPNPSLLWGADPTVLPSFKVSYNPGTNKVTVEWIQDSNGCADFTLSVLNSAGTITIGTSSLISRNSVGLRSTQINCSLVAGNSYMLTATFSGGCSPVNIPVPFVA